MKWGGGALAPIKWSLIFSFLFVESIVILEIMRSGLIHFLNLNSLKFYFFSMKSKIIVLFTLLLAANNAFAQSNLTAIKAFEKQRYQALVDADISKTTQLITNDLLYTHSNLNFEDKQAYLLALKSGKYKFESFVTDSTQYVFLNKKTVIAAGLVHMQGRYYDTPYKLDGRFTAVYIKRKRQWQLAAWQTTKKVN